MDEIETRSGATALNKHKGLQQFFKWLEQDEQDIDRSPMERVFVSRWVRRRRERCRWQG